jgi:large subunit ribosomal protein L5
MKMKTIKMLEKEIFGALKDQFGWTNVMEAPRLKMIKVSVGVGSRYDNKKREVVYERLARITGQKPVIAKAKIAIASYKTRVGDVVGTHVTLRGEKMHSFMEKLIHIVFPRVRDFQGISPKIIDNMGNASVGIKENSVFPECGEEDLKDVFSLGITIVTSAKNKAVCEAYLRHIGFPFIRVEAKK